MTKENFLLKLKETNPAEIRDTWSALGETVCTTRTKMYTKDTLFKMIEENCPLTNAYIFVKNTYSVDNKIYPCIDWKTCTVDELESKVVTWQGVTTPFFRVIALDSDLPSIDEVPINEDYIPFSNMKAIDEVNIDDDELIRLLIGLGVPFLRLDELEYDRHTICEYMIKPALDVIFGLFPIVDEEGIGALSPNQEFLIPFPKGAHGCQMFYTTGAGAATAAGLTKMTNAFAFCREQMMSGSGNVGGGSGFGRWGNGLRYSKAVPGFTGQHSGLPGSSYMNQMIDSNAAAQGMINYFRAEKYSKKKIDGQMYAYGFSTVGGFLNARWLKHSYDFDDVRYELIDHTRRLCQAYIYMNFGLLRNMVKSDVPGQIDYDSLKQRGEKLEQEVRDELKKQNYALSLAVQRGGK